MTTAAGGDPFVRDAPTSRCVHPVALHFCCHTLATKHLQHVCGGGGGNTLSRM